MILLIFVTVVQWSNISSMVRFFWAHCPHLKPFQHGNVLGAAILRQVSFCGVVRMIVWGSFCQTRFSEEGCLNIQQYPMAWSLLVDLDGRRESLSAGCISNMGFDYVWGVSFNYWSRLSIIQGVICMCTAGWRRPRRRLKINIVSECVHQQGLDLDNAIFQIRSGASLTCYFWLYYG